MSIEGRDALKNTQLISRTHGGNGCGRAVRLDCGPQSEAVVNRHAETGEKRSREASEPLPRRNRHVSMMEMLRDLTFRACFGLQTWGLADVVVRTNKNEVIGILQESPERFDLRGGCSLTGPERIEADHYERVDRRKKEVIDLRRGEII